MVESLSLYFYAIFACGKYATNENLSLLTNTCSEKCKKEKKRRSVQGYLANLSEEEKEATRQRNLDRYYKLTEEQRIGNQQRKKERYANLSEEEEKEAERKKFRAEWKRRMEKIKADPEKYKEYKRKGNLACRKYRAKTALAKFEEME